MDEQLDIYSDDAPKTELRHDKLGTRPFAKRLAGILVRLPAPNGYVVGLHGTWGSGKTSVLNFVRRYVDKHNAENEEQPSVLWLEFQPWMTSGHQDLTSAFFKVLGEELKGRPKTLTQRLKHARPVSDAVFDSIDKLSWLTAHGHGGALPAGIKVVKAGFNSMVNRLAEEPSLQKEHARLVDALRNSDRKLLVVIDDIDRLRKDEILQMMMMVKTVGQLPNVIYLLAYDQRIVWDALAEGKQSSEGLPSYAEKIIQQEVALPVPGPDQLLTLFEAEVGFLALPASSRERIGTLARHGLRRWLRTPRDVLRFVNNLRFAWGSIAEYLDPVDYIIIEGVRTFDKEAFDFIRNGRNFLFPPSLSWFSEDRDDMEAVKQFRAKVAAAEIRSLTELVSLLFPQRKAAFEHTEEERSKGKLKESYGESAVEVRRRRGLGFVDSYDSYFQLYPPSRLTSRSTVDNFMARLNDEDWLVKVVNDAQNKVRRDEPFMTADFVRDIADRISQPAVWRASRQPTSTLTLLRAVVRVFALRLQSTPPRFSLISLKNLLTAILDDLPEGPATNELVSLLGEVTTGTAAYLTCVILQQMGNMPAVGSVRHDLIGRENGEKVAYDLVKRIEAERATGTLIQTKPVFDTLLLWELVKGLDAPRDWIAENLNDQTLLRELSNLFVYCDGGGLWRAYSRSPNGSENVMRFFDLGTLSDAVARLRANADLTEDEREMVQVWLDSLANEHEHGGEDE